MTTARLEMRARGVLVGREKYIDLPIVELYDLATDPAEKANIAATRTDRARVMVETLKQFNVAPYGDKLWLVPDWWRWAQAALMVTLTTGPGRAAAIAPAI